jgi:hypothetical protein
LRGNKPLFHDLFPIFYFAIEYIIAEFALSTDSWRARRYAVFLRICQGESGGASGGSVSARRGRRALQGQETVFRGIWKRGTRRPYEEGIGLNLRAGRRALTPLSRRAATAPRVARHFCENAKSRFAQALPRAEPVPPRAPSALRERRRIGGAGRRRAAEGSGPCKQCGVYEHCERTAPLKGEPSFIGRTVFRAAAAGIKAEGGETAGRGSDI